jgi:hypothetical protein
MVPRAPSTSVWLQYSWSRRSGDVLALIDGEKNTLHGISQIRRILSFPCRVQPCAQKPDERASCRITEPI